ncbi:6-phosphofructo-2-kinase-domain-containing protein, partial [Ochromonadaceae sp. CCMP2298]
PLSIFPIRADTFCFCFCGLPGRGKTHLARRLMKYLSFFHAVPVQVYNAAEYRRRMCGSLPDAEWFDPLNEEAKAQRDLCNSTIITDMIGFLNSHANGIAIVDSTNPTHERRERLLRLVQASTGAKVMFIEVVNEDVSFLDRQYSDAASLSPDYAGVNHDEGMTAYRRKIDDYKSIYEPLDNGQTHEQEQRWSYLKADHSTQHFVVNNARGYLQQKVVNFLMNLRTTSHAFFLSRHGQSEYNNLGRIGGDSGLSFHGVKYAEKLAEFVETKLSKDESGREIPTRLWTSSMRRTKETTQFIKQKKLVISPDALDASLDYEWIQMRPRAWHHLDELFAGSCDGMTYAEIEQTFPEEWVLRKDDKLAYRYPRGESYLDVIARLEPIIIEMERHREPLLIVAHQGILRIIYAFYMDKTRAEAPYLSIPLNVVVELNPGPVLCSERRHKLYSPPLSLLPDGQEEPQGENEKIRAAFHDPPSH